MQTRLSSRLHVLRLAGVLLFSATSAAAQSGNTDHLVHDDARVLPAGVAERLEQRLRHYADSSGVVLAVATVKSLHGQEIAQVGDSIKNAWGIGSKQTQRGILYLVAVADRRSTIRTGRGVEADLPDALCLRILKQSRPTIREDAPGAILSRVAGIQAQLAKAAAAERARIDLLQAERIMEDVNTVDVVTKADTTEDLISTALLWLMAGMMAAMMAIGLRRILRDSEQTPARKPTPGPRRSPATPPRAHLGESVSSSNSFFLVDTSTSDDDDSSRKSSSSPWGGSSYSFGFGSDDTSSGSSFSSGGDSDTGGGGASSDD